MPSRHSFQSDRTYSQVFKNLINFTSESHGNAVMSGLVPTKEKTYASSLIAQTKLDEKLSKDSDEDLYLSRCQVDTPHAIVDLVWRHVRERRGSFIDKVVDFGCGDCRFATNREFGRYLGFEIDPDRLPSSDLSSRITVLNVCAFSEPLSDADLCIGNPPYVRNQDLPAGWIESVGSKLQERTAVSVSGLANAWQYFFLLALASTKPDGLVALVIPYEWVSRPSVRALRDYVRDNDWNVAVYRLCDDVFPEVMTTASITIVDKKDPKGEWKYFSEAANGEFTELVSESSSKSGVVKYLRKSQMKNGTVHAKRGLSPGTQKLLVLTESERNKNELKVGTDVVPCITSLKRIGSDQRVLTDEDFNLLFRDSGAKCWLINTLLEPSKELRKYLEGCKPTEDMTVTCKIRDEWWKFTMPSVPSVLSASAFAGQRPKMVANKVGAVAVGGVIGIYGVEKNSQEAFVAMFENLDLSGRIVPHSNGFTKVEINQMNALIEELTVICSSEGE